MSVDFEKLSRLGFGLMRLPQKEESVDTHRVEEMVDTYMASGFHYFDTAYIYHGGQSETAIREVLVKRYPRDSFMLTDKLAVWMLKSFEDRDRMLQEQLQRCGVSYFDIYLLHSLEEGVNYDNAVKYDCFEWIKQKKIEGTVKHIGFSFHGSPELLDRILTEHPEIEVVQIQLNYLDWSSPVLRAKESYEILRKHNKPIIVMEPIRGGALANVPEQASKLLKQARPQQSTASWALRFVASLPGIVTVLSGMSTQEQMDDNLKTFGEFEPLTCEEQSVIEDVRRILTAGNTVLCTACRYCCDGCSAGINIPEIFKVLSDVRLNGLNDRARGFYANFAGAKARAQDCLECGQCEAVCPQHLNIIELLKEAAEKLDHVQR